MHIVYPNHLAVAPALDAISALEWNLWTQQYDGLAGNLVDIYFQANQTFAHSRPLYTDKMWDLMGAPLTVATITYLPYTMTEFVVCVI